jgi:hypothetical protein
MAERGRRKTQEGRRGFYLIQPIGSGRARKKKNWWSVLPRDVLGNLGNLVTLETLSLTKFLRHVFQEQETHDFRKTGTCEASDSRMREVRES